MAKRFSSEFKQQAIDYALANSNEPLSTIANKLGIGYSTLDKWVCQSSEAGSIKRQLTLEQHRILDLEKRE